MVKVLVINPNSNVTVTQAMQSALLPLGVIAGMEVVCETLPKGPFGIESQSDIDSVTLPLRDFVVGSDADAFVIACYSDPGLHLCREATKRPVFGIGEAAISTALATADRFGVLAILRRSIPRHMRKIREMGVAERLAGERSLEMHVHELVDAERVLARMLEVGRALIAHDGADVLILGCAGMGAYRAEMEKRLSVPVIDPVQAGVSLAVARLVFSDAQRLDH